jgi:hypothetical protein
LTRLHTPFVPLSILSISEHAATLFLLIFYPPPSLRGRQAIHPHHRARLAAAKMSYAYPRSAGASSLPSFNSISGSASGRIWQALERLPSTAKQWVAEGTAGFGRTRGRTDARGLARLVLRRLFTVANALILVWLFTLWRGERTVFQEAIDRCLWESWEKWVCYLRQPRSFTCMLWEYTSLH